MRSVNALLKNEISLRTATGQDNDAIAALAKRIWQAHYPSIISQAQIDYLLHLFYSPAALENQIKNPKAHTFLIYDGAEMVGFCGIEQQSPTHFHIHKFYIDTARHRSGLGSALMQHTIDHCKAAEITLMVARKNHKAINFYFRQGFTIDHIEDRDVGKGFVMEDFVMRRARPAHG